MTMILWEKQICLDKSLFKQLDEKLKTLENNGQEFITTYKYKDGNVINYLEDQTEITNFYNSISDKFMSDLGLYHLTKYQRPFWAQKYNSETVGHPPHIHFSGTEILSWVHFIEVPNQKCFYFLNSKGNKIYPKQNKSRFIVFPSWAVHGVDKVKRKNYDRIIIAGNISLLGFYFNGLNLESQKTDNTSLWTVEKY